ncbi:iron transporter [Streptomyces reniochalinae]|uniref:Iron transporter n=2 Tax=Streptomyces reniochalinae TaxID=2250578 RepID=A0A367E609_9ACTN|nr:iron transporter [Streptomyces reniochalinae]
MVPPQERRVGHHEDLIHRSDAQPSEPLTSCELSEPPGQQPPTDQPGVLSPGPVTPAAAAPDPLQRRDPGAAADAAAAENLLRCWVRETGLARPRNGVLRVPLPASGTALLVSVRHWSPAGLHRFDPPRLAGAPEDAAPLDAVCLAALLGREAAHGTGVTGAGDREASCRTEAHGRNGAHVAQEHKNVSVESNVLGRQGPTTTDGTLAPGSVPERGRAPEPESTSARGDAPVLEGAALVGRVADSVQRTARFLADRRTHPGPPPGTGPFLDGEQALLFGHPLHPTPKSREGLSETEERMYSPELRGSFPLHWMAVHPSVLSCDSAWTDRGKPVPAPDLARRLGGGRELAERLPGDCVPLPLHPWQAGEVRRDAAVRALLDAGLLHDLGQSGGHWHPTSSVRTVFRQDSPAMLKLSLGVRITNSRRDNLRKELLRGIEVHRLLRGGIGAAWRAAHPGFDVVRDPAWLGVDVPGEGRLHGFDTVIRHNPFGAGEDAVCLAGLTAPVPGPRGVPGPPRSRLGALVTALAQRTGRSPGAVATEWFLRYLDVVVRPVLWLDAHAGIALEAHQQNTLVLLDTHGWPRGGRYRDNQGYYFRASHRDALTRRLPGAELGVASDTFVADDVTDERFAYYLGINNVFGLVGAFGSQQLADERLLFAAFRRFLEHAAREEPASGLPALLLETPVLRCKANLLTRLHGLDELVGPVDSQSVYVALDNPLVP